MNTLKSVFKSALLATLISSSLAGCLTTTEGSDPIVADWQGDRVGSQQNELLIDEDLRGEATLFFLIEGDLFFLEFDARVDVESQGDRYDIDMECVGCPELDFTMECEMSKRGDELECEGTDIFRGLEFNWEID